MSERPLTPGEIALARRVFKDSIDYGKVKIHKGRYIVGQPDNSGITPNGEIYVVGAQTYFDDYSVATVYQRSFFIHEMAHVWQYQLKVLKPIAAAIGEFFRHRFDYAKAYDYELVPGKDLLKYRIEQQAQIIQDYYLLHVEGTAPSSHHIKNSGDAAECLPLYCQVLANFRTNSAYAVRDATAPHAS